MNAPIESEVEFALRELPQRTTWLRAPVLAAALAGLGILALYWPTAASIVAIWLRSETFAHGFVVIPICLWLVWRKRRELETLTAEPWWPGLALVLVSGALWLVMSVADVLGLKQFALAFMVQAAIITVIGKRVTRALVFPLTFLLFAIPVGEMFVPTLIDWTADFTFAALRFSRVPVYREANFFIIPSGIWSIVEACSGIRYIIASVMVGTIYAAVAYRSVRRRVLFVAASIVVPIVANWMRAYMIVMIGHLSNNKLAAGVDHIIYGWIFFGVVMVLLFWVGSFWQEDAATFPAVDRSSTHPSERSDPASATRFFSAAVAAILVAGIWVALAPAVRSAEASPKAELPVLAGEQGWVVQSAPVASWKPHYQGYAAELRQTFNHTGAEVGLYIAYYVNQEKGRELITSGNLLTPRDDFNWKHLTDGTSHVEWSGHDIPVNEVELSGPAMSLKVFRLYWIDGRVTANEYMAKALLAWSKLSGHGDDSALIVFYAPVRTSEETAREALRAFAAAMSPQIERMLSAAARASAR